MNHPCVRYVDAIPVRQKKQVLVLLRDPEELSAGEMVITPGAYILMTLLDGTRDAEAIQKALLERSGEVVPRDSINDFIRQLDEAYLLENDRTRARRQAVLDEYRALPSRPAAHAGASYPDQPAHLQRSMDMLFAATDEEPPQTRGANGSPRGLIVPHIDIRCGGACMARGFRTLRGAEAAPERRYVILGVAHHPTPHLYTLTEKDFDTPLGAVRTDRQLTGRLKELYGDHLLEGELAHKREHSVEFAALFLKYLHGDRDNFSIVPLLCGSLHEELNGPEPKSPHTREDVGAFCRALRTLMEEDGPPLCIVASVDLSHVGKKFGDETGVDPARAEQIRAADLEMLERVRQRDAEAFFDHFRSDANGRNVDAVTAVYTLLHTLGGGTAELIAYDQHLEFATESMVSFASMALY